MRKKIILICMTVLMFVFVTACSENSDNSNTTTTVSDSQNEQDSSVQLEDGSYQADFNTDSGMFHVNEANKGKGTLTVKDGKMTIHVSLVSKKILNLYYGTAEDAQKEGAALLNPTTDTVEYEDGTKEEVYGFDIPVPTLDEEYDVALVGEKGTWYDHKVSVSNPKEIKDNEESK